MINREITVDGIRIHLAEAGSGPPLLLLHGLAATHDNWQHTLAAFAGRWRVIAPDLPGHGQSAKPNAPYTIDFYAGVIRSLGHELGVDEAVVVGNSLGGLIALELGCTYSRWTRALVLVAPAGGFPAAMRPVGWALGAVTGASVLRMALGSGRDHCFYDPTAPGAAERRRLLLERLRHEDYPHFARAVRRSLVGAIGAARQPLENLVQPTLLVWGRQDRLVGLSRSRQLLREVPHARLEVIDRCGHLPMLERPEEFNRIVGEFLRAVEAAPRLHVRAAGAR
jgi:pimeloyl-ACP methyl ester carboxylesterase